MSNHLIPDRPVAWAEWNEVKRREVTMKATTKKLYTIGYQGLSWREFIALLKQHNIDVVADVRATARSRTREYNLRYLRDGLEAEGIAWVHFPRLGIPTARRKRFRERALLLKVYDEDILPSQIACRTAPNDWARLNAWLANKDLTICLLCMEANPATCHRSVLAERLQEIIQGLEVVHLRRENV